MRGEKPVTLAALAGTAASRQARYRCRTPCPRNGNRGHNFPDRRRGAAGDASPLSASAPPVHGRARAETSPTPYDCRCPRSEEHTSELQSLMRISYAVFCLKKKKHTNKIQI